MSDDLSLPLFVYGTLKRGESRAGKWPFPPVKVCPAAIHSSRQSLAGCSCLWQASSPFIFYCEVTTLRAADS